MSDGRSVGMPFAGEPGQIRAVSPRNTHGALTLLVALWLTPSAATGDDARTIELKADRAEGDLDGTCVRLEGNVSLLSGRLRLSADALEMRQPGDGRIELTGPVTLAPCPCEKAPFTLRLQRATLHPDGDLTAAGVTIKLAGAPVLYTPWLWLRPIDKVGLLAPRIAYRAHDGLLLGAGVHLPASGRAYLDLEPGIYLRGGHELLARVVAGPMSARIRWDHRETDLVSVRAQGATGEHVALAWSADVVRGARGRSASIELDAAARAYDRASLALIVPAAGSLSVGGRTSLERGQGTFLAGPRLSWATSHALTRGISAWLSLDGSSLATSDGGGLWHVGRAEGRVLAETYAGAVWLSSEARAVSTGYVMPDAARDDSFVQMRAAASLPLARRFEHAMHLISPELSLLALASHASPGLPGRLGQPLEGSSGEVALPSASIESSYGSTEGGSVSAHVGTGVLLSRAAARTLAIAGASAEATWLRARLEAASSGNPSHADALLLSSVWLGPPRWFAAGAVVEGQRGLSPVESRALLGPSQISSGWLAHEGWTATAGLTAGLGGALSARAWASMDLTAKQRLGERASLLYNHPCGCLAAGLHAGHRLGREGLDLWLTLGLASN